MTNLPGHRLGRGPLTFSQVVRDAIGMLRQSFRRVALVSLLLFGLPALLAALVDRLLEGIEGDIGFLPVSFVVVALLVTIPLRLFGPVLYAGFLDEAVAREYLHGHHMKFSEVVRTLPWGRLVIADVLLSIGTVIGLALFIVPGVIVYILFGLVGPVLVQERRGVVDAFKRTSRISRTAVLPMIVLVIIPVVFEQTIHELVHDTLHAAGLEFQVIAEWLVAVLIGATVGLLEVALAAELMARNPEPRLEAPSA
ncbi:MAG TPA: hypothetical protein VEX62_12430 [Candidatus Limnocylindrales bacterium]|nr:hypothetical protein [Candidatus Limnocylindrales bacterium]